MQPAFRKHLLGWFASNARTLPWRTKPGPYRVWVSEIMLQQTRVEAVRGHYTRFLQRFPTVRKLAAADLEEVLEAWSGLGYYRRARMLHTAAQRIVAEHAGRFPATRGAVIALPGVGPYTAGAILSIAFNQPEPIVDGNVERVFARLAALDQNVKAGPGRQAVWALATEHVRRGHSEGHAPSALNQAVMELGAVVCLPNNPLCADCPVRRHCKAHKAGEVDRFPVLPGRAAKHDRKYRFVALRDADARVLMVRRAEGDDSSLLPAGMWELPHTDATDPDGRLAGIGVPVRIAEDLLTRRHTIMNYRLTLELLTGAPAARVRTSANRRWFTLEEAEAAAISSATRKLLRALAAPVRDA
ncbi:MAG: A/G-specific adenine glycosylase [Planctomycetes bacterium]|nr:A/G-specific adenine glycosylase [Planctomycetota bacterium]